MKKRNKEIDALPRKEKERIIQKYISEVEKTKSIIYEKQRDIRTILFEICSIQGNKGLGFLEPKNLTDFVTYDDNNDISISKLEDLIIPKDPKINGLDKYNLILEYLTWICHILNNLREIAVLFKGFDFDTSEKTVFLDVGASYEYLGVILLGMKWIGYNPSDQYAKDIKYKLENYIIPMLQIMGHKINMEDYFEFRKDFFLEGITLERRADYSVLKLSLHHLGEKINQNKKIAFDIDLTKRIVINLCRNTSHTMLIGDRFKNERNIEKFQPRDRDNPIDINNSLNPKELKDLIDTLTRKGNTVTFENDFTEQLYNTLIKPDCDTTHGFNHDHFLWFSIRKNSKKS